MTDGAGALDAKLRRLAEATIVNCLYEELGRRKAKALTKAHEQGPGPFAAWFRAELGRDLETDVLPAVIAAMQQEYMAGRPVSPVERSEANRRIVRNVLQLG